MCTHLSVGIFTCVVAGVQLLSTSPSISTFHLGGFDRWCASLYSTRAFAASTTTTSHTIYEIHVLNIEHRIGMIPR